MAAKTHFSEIAGLFDDAVPQTDERLSNGSQLAVRETAYAATPDPFDYVPLSLSAGEQLRLETCRSRIVVILSTAIIEAGRELLSAKAIILSRCPRGTWSRWLKASLGVSETTARNYMAAAEWATKTPTVGEMPPGAIYRGAVAPPEVQADIVQRLTNGEVVQADQITKMIAAHRQAKGERLRVAETKDRALDSAAANSPTKSAAQENGDTQLAVGGVAAREVVARLRKVMGDPAILDLVELVSQTSPDALRQALSANRYEDSGG